LYIHFKGKEGWPIPQIHDVFDQIMEYSLINPADLLPRHRHLLEIDFELIGRGSSAHCLIWISDMESALSVSRLYRSGSLTPLAISHFSNK
jgi:hypothetical protein